MTLCLDYKTQCSDQFSDTIRYAIKNKLSTCSLLSGSSHSDLDYLVIWWQGSDSPSVLSMWGGEVLCSFELHVLPYGFGFVSAGFGRDQGAFPLVFVTCWCGSWCSGLGTGFKFGFCLCAWVWTLLLHVLQCERTVEVLIHSPSARVLRHCLSFWWAHGVCFVIRAMHSCLSCYPTPLVICTWIHLFTAMFPYSFVIRFPTYAPFVCCISLCLYACPLPCSCLFTVFFPVYIHHSGFLLWGVFCCCF